MSNNPWQAFDGFQTLTTYSNEWIADFATRLIETDDETEILETYAQLVAYGKVLDILKDNIRPTITQIMMNQAKPIEVGGVKFVYSPKIAYEYHTNQVWQKSNDEVQVASEYRKIIEKACKEGGEIDGVYIEAVPKIVEDNFTATLLKKKPDADSNE